MKKLLFAAVLAIMLTTILKAQDYETGIGLRLGTGTGLTVKHFVNQKAAFEGMLLTRWPGFDITGLYEIHGQAFETNFLNWYYGFGAHIGFYNGDYVEWGSPGSTYTVFGIDGIIGIEYTFRDAPVNLGLDFKPMLNLVGYTGLWPEVAVSVRYVFR